MHYLNVILLKVYIPKWLLILVCFQDKQILQMLYLYYITFICELCSQKLPFVNSDNYFCPPHCDKCKLYKAIISSNVCYFTLFFS